LEIDGRLIGLNEPTYFIADIAANHNGDLGKAKELIGLAAEAGADAVKFQHFRAEHIVSDRGFKELGKLDHQAKWGKSVFEVYSDASLDWSWTEVLQREAKENGVHFFTSPYDFGAVDHVDPYVPAYKIGSGDINWIEIVEYIASKGKPVIAATGASSLEDVQKAVEVLEKAKVPYSVMQCNTNYTGSDENFNFINLRVLETYKKLFPRAILGLSDHTSGHATVLGAVAMGARVIEKHFTDDQEQEGPDHYFSMTPKSWKEMILNTRQLESALGDGQKRVEINEVQSSLIQRRGVRFSTNLQKGHVLTREDLVVLRPMTSACYPADRVSEILGRFLAANVTEHQEVTETLLSETRN
jgi:N-acetylneuraminate synthase